MSSSPREKPDSSYIFTREIFVRFLGLIYVMAFASLGAQILGLNGSHGILPAAPVLKAVSLRYGLERFWLLPTIFWFNASDGFLFWACWAGAALGAAVALNVWPRLILFLLWVLYLSLVNVGQDFLGFQWDNLLLEAGFLAIFFAPGYIFHRRGPPEQPSPVVLWLLRWLLFRLMFESGAVKLLGGDETWRHLTALTYHYWTQPLPNVISWCIAQAPAWFHKLSALVVFVVEGIVPFLIFFPRPVRRWAFFILAGFQIIILLTGNYCFFNFLTILLCVTLLDDQFLKKYLPGGWIERMEKHFKEIEKPPRRWGEKFLAGCLAVLVGTVSVRQLLAFPFASLPFLKPVDQVVRVIEPFRTINTYGLFSMMTTKRLEIIIQGSRDGQAWLDYEFKWKPGRLDRAPGWAAPHQPRLDWQMWFAALGEYRQNPWVLRFMARLLQNEKCVLDLLASNPFPDAPPQYIRAVVYDYHFTNFQVQRQTGAWWERELVGPYTPVVDLKK